MTSACQSSSSASAKAVGRIAARRRSTRAESVTISSSRPRAAGPRGGTSLLLTKSHSRKKGPSAALGTTDCSSDRLVLNLAAKIAADLVELRALLDLEAARPREWNFNVGNHLARPLAHHQHPVGEIDGFADAVGDEDRGAVMLLPDLHQREVHLVARDRVEGAERLVHQQQVGLEDQRAAD